MFKKLSLFHDENSNKVFFKNLPIGLALFVVALLILLLPLKTKQKPEIDAQFSAVDRICELATLKCYYHDVAEYEKQPDWLFKYGLLQYGYKKIWLEYDGIVTVGIDVNKVRVSKPNEEGVVEIYVPEARVIDVDVNESSMSEPIIDKKVLTTVTIEDKAHAFSETQATMRKNAENDSSLLLQAQKNAKELLKQYVLEVGKQLNQSFTVKWVDDATFILITNKK